MAGKSRLEEICGGAKPSPAEAARKGIHGRGRGVCYRGQITELWQWAAWATRPSFGEPQGHPRLAGRGPPHRRHDEWGQDPLIRVNPETCPQPPPSDSHPGCRGQRCPLPSRSLPRGSYNAHSLIRPTTPPPRHCDHREAEAASTVPEGSRAPRRVTHRPGFVCRLPGDTHALYV